MISVDNDTVELLQPRFEIAAIIQQAMERVLYRGNNSARGRYRCCQLDTMVDVCQRRKHSQP